MALWPASPPATTRRWRAKASGVPAHWSPPSKGNGCSSRKAATASRRSKNRRSPVAADLAALQETAARLDVRWRLRILGHTSPEGSDAVNQRIARRRAEAVRQVLVRQGFPAEQIEAEAEGTVTTAAEASAKEAQRRSVTFEVVTEE